MKLAEGPRRELMEDASRPSDDGREVPRSRVRRWARRVGTSLLWLAVIALLAITFGPSFLPFRSHAVLGASMEPTIPFRSVAIFVSAEAQDLHVGDVIAFHPPSQPERLITHRIVSDEVTPEGRFFLTQGDANGAPDSWRIPARGEGWRYAFHVPFLGYLQFAMVTAAGRAVMITIAALAFGAWALVRIWRPARERGGS